MIATAPVRVTGRVDALGRLIEADPRLAALQRAAGGELDDVLAVPALAAVAHMAQTLQTPVARTVIAAEGDRVVQLHVAASPTQGSVAMVIEGWTSLARSADAFGVSAAPQTIDWLITTDMTLRIARIAGADAPRSWVGQRLDTLVELLPNDEDEMPMLAGLSMRQGFARQHVRLRADRDEEAPAAELAALPYFDAAGQFVGWRGRIRAQPSEATAPVVPVAAASTPTHAPAIATVAQSLQPALNAIITDAEAMAQQSDGPLSERYIDYANDIAAASRHLLGLIDDVRDAEAVDAPDFVPDIDLIDAADVARRAARLLAVRADADKVRIDPPADDESMMVRADFRRVMQVMLNLVGNALRYSPPGATIWLRCEQQADLVSIVVADQGKGIAADQQHRIFERHYRVDPSEPGGSGLGLYISRRLARAMGGDITVDSAPGQGARFILTLPLAEV